MARFNLTLYELNLSWCKIIFLTSGKIFTKNGFKPTDGLLRATNETLNVVILRLQLTAHNWWVSLSSYFKDSTGIRLKSSVQYNLYYFISAALIVSNMNKISILSLIVHTSTMHNILCEDSPLFVQASRSWTVDIKPQFLLHLLDVFLK